MGFTRYWTRPKTLDAAIFRRFSESCRKTCEYFEGTLVNAVFDAVQVRFDATPGCETFLIQQVSMEDEEHGEVFEFCKTRELPYDRAVEKCLNILKEHFPEVTIHEPS